MHAALKYMMLVTLVLLAGIVAVSAQTAVSAQNTTLSWNYGDLRAVVDHSGSYTLMTKVTDYHGTTGYTVAEPVYLVAGKNNAIGISSQSVQRIADGKGPGQFVEFWLQLDGQKVSDKLWRPY